MLAQIGNDKFLTAQLMGLFDAGGQDGVGLGRVAADDQNHAGILDVPDRSRIAAVTNGAEQTFGGGCLAVARAIVHVVRADDRARQLLHEITFLVGAFRGRDEGERIRSVLRLDLGELLRHQGQGFLPTCLAKLVAFTDEW